MMRLEGNDFRKESLDMDVVDKSDNSGQVIFHKDVESGEAGIMDPAKNTELTQFDQLRSQLRIIVEHIAFRLFGLLLITIDIILLIVDLSIKDKTTNEETTYDMIAMVFICYFMIEVSVRLFAKGVHDFFIAWYNVVDLVVIVVSFIITIIYSTVDFANAGYAKLVVIGRLVRLVLFVRLCTERKHIEKGVRHVVGENKRRYKKDGFDLDLTYVTEKIIAMSFPSSGRMSMYRNPIKQVAKFFNTKHPDHYRIYNLCSERSYDTSYFHGRVRRYMIDDHNVPSLKDIIAFCEDVQKWLDHDESNVIAVHCKGGKGRTGTMICVWLIHCNLFESAETSLDYFGDRRTDLEVGTKFQGVQTPSQSRYVGYYNIIHNQLNDVLPEEVLLHLTRIKIYAFAGIGVGNGSDFWSEIFIRRKKIFECIFGTEQNCLAKYDADEDFLDVTVVNCPVLAGDIRIKFQTSNEKVPKNYENCPFYLWFHTSFIDNYRLYIKREELDNPHNCKTWKTFRESFAVELFFSKPDEEVPLNGDH
ncbi:TPTE2 (predicted) [Pycnogonum litorale]